MRLTNERELCYWSPGTRHHQKLHLSSDPATQGREGGGVTAPFLSSSRPLIFLLRSHWLNPAGSRETPERDRGRAHRPRGSVGLWSQQSGNRLRANQYSHPLELSNTWSRVCGFEPSDACITLPLKRLMPQRRKRCWAEVEAKAPTPPA